MHTKKARCVICNRKKSISALNEFMHFETEKPIYMCQACWEPLHEESHRQMDEDGSCISVISLSALPPTTH